MKDKIIKINKSFKIIKKVNKLNKIIKENN